MKITLKAILISLFLCFLCSCNTTKGLSQDINNASDSVARAVNS